MHIDWEGTAGAKAQGKESGGVMVGDGGRRSRPGRPEQFEHEG